MYLIVLKFTNNINIYYAGRQLHLFKIINQKNYKYIRKKTINYHRNLPQSEVAEDDSRENIKMVKILYFHQKQLVKALINEKGTSLLEVLGSLFIVILILQLTYIIAFSTSQTFRARHNTSASYYAVSLIESIRAGGNIDTGSYQIPEGGNLNGITPPDGMEAQVSVIAVEDNPFLFLIEVTVYWLERGRPQQLKIESLIRKDFN